ncbi:MAG: cyclase family protein [bacterium]|nr:cyclase family protein [Candidatus Microgenomates bacterium CPR3]MCQ3944970.1 cyclase family protein [bacterium]RIK50841.1 MAG: cyclase [Candidatus Microgenomates bacterium]
MQIVDLSQPLFDGMPVYPGDPEVHIKQIHSLDQEGWRLRYLQMSTHIGTHADAFFHMDESGETIDNIPIDRYIGETRLVDIDQDLPVGIGLAFCKGELNLSHFDKLHSASPRFVVIGDSAVLDVELERKLLQSGILTITDLVNMSALPTDKPFMFYAVPLKIKNGDGSPVRAFAVLN